MEKKPRVTIGMPVFNGEKFISVAIDSILAQTFEDFELIISDNASTDKTEEICSYYKNLDSRIQYHRLKENCGAAKNYVHVLNRARGEYFRWVNHDDYCAPKSLELCVDVLDKNKTAVLCYPKTIIVDDKGDMVRKYDDNLSLRHAEAIDRFRCFYENIGLSNVLFGLMRSDVLRKTSLMESFMGADIVLIAELTLYGEFIEIPEYLFYRRFHDKSSSSDKSLKAQQQFFDPKTIGKISIPSWKHMSRNLKSVSKSSLCRGEKLKLSWFILRKAIRERDHFFSDARDALQLYYYRYR